MWEFILVPSSVDRRFKFARLMSRHGNTIAEMDLIAHPGIEWFFPTSSEQSGHNTIVVATLTLVKDCRAGGIEISRADVRLIAARDL